MYLVNKLLLRVKELREIVNDLEALEETRELSYAQDLELIEAYKLLDLETNRLMRLTQDIDFLIRGRKVLMIH